MMLTRIKDTRLLGLLAVWLLWIAQCSAAPTIDPCQRQPFVSSCTNPDDSVTKSQFVLRYYRRNGSECVSYPYGHCRKIPEVPELYKYKDECEKNCLNAPSSVSTGPQAGDGTTAEIPTTQAGTTVIVTTSRAVRTEVVALLETPVAPVVPVVPASEAPVAPAAPATEAPAAPQGPSDQVPIVLPTGTSLPDAQAPTAPEDPSIITENVETSEGTSMPKVTVDELSIDSSEESTNDPLAVTASQVNAAAAAADPHDMVFPIDRHAAVTQFQAPSSTTTTRTKTVASTSTANTDPFEIASTNGPTAENTLGDLDLSEATTGAARPVVTAGASAAATALNPVVPTQGAPTIAPAAVLANSAQEPVGHGLINLAAGQIPAEPLAPAVTTGGTQAASIPTVAAPIAQQPLIPASEAPATISNPVAVVQTAAGTQATASAVPLTSSTAASVPIQLPTQPASSAPVVISSSSAAVPTTTQGPPAVTTISTTGSTRAGFLDILPSSPSKCVQQRLAALERQQTNGATPLSDQVTKSLSVTIDAGFLPKCTPSGTYEQVQCDSAQTVCWCVDGEDGVESPGTRTPIGQGRPRCTTNIIDWDPSHPGITYQPKPGQCPTPKGDEYSVCVHECRKDPDCPGMAKCCYNGCGRLCLVPRIPYAKWMYSNLRLDSTATTPIPVAALAPQCDAKSDAGPCKLTIPLIRWYYDTAKQTCQTFHYGGCGGNGNNYDSKKDCESRCINQDSPQCNKGAKPLDSPSGQPYNCLNQSCPVGWKCTFARSEAVCCPEDSTESKKAGSLTEACKLSKDRGTCEKYELRFYYNNDAKECKYFFYGGCAGNANNFKELAECERVCGKGGDSSSSDPSTPSTDPGSQSSTDKPAAALEFPDFALLPTKPVAISTTSATTTIAAASTGPVQFPDFGQLPTKPHNETFASTISTSSASSVSTRTTTVTTKSSTSVIQPVNPQFPDFGALPKSTASVETSTSAQITGQAPAGPLFPDFGPLSTRAGAPTPIPPNPAPAPATVPSNQPGGNFPDFGPLATSSRPAVVPGQASQQFPNFAPVPNPITRAPISDPATANRAPAVAPLDDRSLQVLNFGQPVNPSAPNPAVNPAVNPPVEPAAKPQVPIGFQIPENPQGTGGVILVGSRLPTTPQVQLPDSSNDDGLVETFSRIPLTSLIAAAASRNLSTTLGTFGLSTRPVNRTTFKLSTPSGSTVQSVASSPAPPQAPAIRPPGANPVPFANSSQGSNVSSSEFQGQTVQKTTGQELPSGTSFFIPGDRCTHPQDLGPCSGRFIRWYWDVVKGDCDVFNYGGCQGNGNNFGSREECVNACKELPRNICLHPSLDGGECPGKFRRYSYEPSDNTCKEFMYGGCGGNGNNFGSLHDCEMKCKNNFAESKCPRVKCSVDCVVITRNNGCQQCACPPIGEEAEDEEALKRFLLNQESIESALGERGALLPETNSPLRGVDFERDTNEITGRKVAKALPEASIDQKSQESTKNAPTSGSKSTSKSNTTQSGTPTTSTSRAPTPDVQVGVADGSIDPARPVIGIPAAPPATGLLPIPLPGEEFGHSDPFVNFPPATPGRQAVLEVPVAAPAVGAQVPTGVAGPADGAPAEAYVVPPWAASPSSVPAAIDVGIKSFGTTAGVAPAATVAPVANGAVAGAPPPVASPNLQVPSAAAPVQPQGQAPSQAPQPPASSPNQGQAPAAQQPAPPKLPLNFCLHPRDAGTCTDNVKTLTRYWYDLSDNSCKPFAYSGCDGNGNNHASKAECQEKCVEGAATDLQIPQQPSNGPTAPQVPPAPAAIPQPAAPAPAPAPSGRVPRPPSIAPPGAGAPASVEAVTLAPFPGAVPAPSVATVPSGAVPAAAALPGAPAVVGSVNPVGTPVPIAPVAPQTSQSPAAVSTYPGAPTLAAAPPASKAQATPTAAPVSSSAAPVAPGLTPAAVFSIPAVAPSVVQPQVPVPSVDSAGPPAVRPPATSSTGATTASFAPQVLVPASTAPQARVSVTTSLAPAVLPAGLPPQARAVLPPPNSADLEKCTQPVDPGPCKGPKKDRFWFNSASGKCEHFLYGGCAGNRNHFYSLNECEIHCGKGAGPKPPPAASTATPDSVPQAPSAISPIAGAKAPAGAPGAAPVLQAPDSAPAQGTITKGDANGAIAVAPPGGAQAPTSPAPPTGPAPIDVCTLQKDQGPCTTFVTRWFHNPANKKCETFQYGSCGGNTNNYESEDLCKARCYAGAAALGIIVPEQCAPDKETGSCKGYHPRWYYNSKNMRCEQFVYGGCDGNSNNFESKSFCEQSCPVEGNLNIDTSGAGPTSPAIQQSPRPVFRLQAGPAPQPPSPTSLQPPGGKAPNPPSGSGGYGGGYGGGEAPAPGGYGEAPSPSGGYGGEEGGYGGQAPADSGSYGTGGYGGEEAAAPAPAGYGEPQAPAGYGEPPAAGGYGEAQAPAPGGYGEPQPPSPGGYGEQQSPAPGGYGEAPAPGGYGEAQAPAPGGYGESEAPGGYGEPQPPAAGGYGEAQAPAGYGTEPPSAGYGSAPAPAPAPGGYGESYGGQTEPPASYGGEQSGSYGAQPPSAGYGQTDDGSVPSCPNGGSAMRHTDGSTMSCLPGKDQCPPQGSCNFNGLNFFCCPGTGEEQQQGGYGSGPAAPPASGGYGEPSPPAPGGYGEQAPAPAGGYEAPAPAPGGYEQSSSSGGYKKTQKRYIRQRRDLRRSGSR